VVSNSGSPSDLKKAPAWKQRLNELGYSEGKNLIFD
jgi:hypothetical protein